MHISRTLGMGGMEQVVATLCRSVDPARFQSSVLCLKGRGPIANQLEAEGVPVFSIDSAEDDADYLAFRKVARWVRSHPVDVVHTHNTTALLFGALGARLGGVRTIVHTDHARLYPERWRIRMAENMLSRLTYRVVAVSEETRADLRRHIRIPAARLVTIPNGIDGSRYRPAIDSPGKRRELGLPAKGPIIGLGARLTEQKGIGCLLRAMYLLRERCPEAVLVIAGEGPSREALIALTHELGLEDRVWFLGLRLDMADLLQLFDVYALPSLWEGLPMALLEAMASELPIVASEVGGVATAVDAGVNGLLVPPDDPEGLADALYRLLTDASLRASMGASSLRLFESRFSATAMASAYEELYLRHGAGEVA